MTHGGWRQPMLLCHNLLSRAGTYYLLRPSFSSGGRFSMATPLGVGLRQCPQSTTKAGLELKGGPQRESSRDYRPVKSD